MKGDSNLGRTQKSIKNILFGILFQITAVLSNFICRTMMIRYLGIEVISLNGLFWEIVSMLSLAELGIGSAMVYHLYQPIAEKNIERIKSIMGLYRTCYRVIALFCLAAGSVLAFFVPFIVNGLSFSDNYLRLVFFLYVLQTSASYLFIADTSLLQADQKRYKTVRIQTGLKLIATLVSIIVLYICQNFLIYLTVTILITLGTNLLCSRQAIMEYPFLKEKYQELPSKEIRLIFTNVRDIFVKKTAGYVTNSTDNLFISSLVGTVQVGFYSNYSMLFHAVRQVEQQVANGLSASMGDLVAKESPDRVDATLKTSAFYFHLFAVVMSCGLMACSSAFVHIWIGAEYLLTAPVICICCVNTYLSIAKEPLWQAMDASGMFSYDRTLAIISTVINFIVSLLLGIKWGMSGIFIGTAVSTIFEIIFKTYGLYKYRLSVSMYKYSMIWLKMIVSEAGSLLISYIIGSISLSNLYLKFLVQGLLSVVSSVVLCIGFFPANFRETICHIIEKIKAKTKK